MIQDNFSVGIDCEDIERWRKMLPRLYKGSQQKLFSDNEHIYCKSRADPASHYAARWCAKEALLNINSFPIWLWKNKVIIELIEWLRNYGPTKNYIKQSKVMKQSL